MENENSTYSFDVFNIKSIPFDKYEKNFTFIVNGERYSTSRFIADLLSPIVAQYHYEDETIDEFTFNTRSKNNQDGKSFGDFLKLISSTDVILNKEQKEQYCEYFIHLGNINEYLRLDPTCISHLTPDNVIDRLKFLTQNKITENAAIEIIQKMIKYASENFIEIPREKIKSIDDINLLEEILKNENLLIEDEDSLLRFVFELYENDRSYSSLFEYVKFNEVSQELLIEFIDHFDIEFLNSGTFRSICKGLLARNEKRKNETRYKEKCLTFLYKNGDEFNGIMKHLTDETGGNIHENGTIKITSNSSSNDFKKIVSYPNGNLYQFDDKENMNLCFDFKDKQVQLTNYSIKSNHWGVNDDHLKNWVLEVSNDGNDWKPVDEHSNDSSLNGPYKIATFKTKEIQSFYQFVRLRQTGRNWHGQPGQYHSAFYLFEFYGKLKNK